MKATQEQQEIVDYAKTDHDFRIMAFAGTGKTTTLTLVAKALPRNGQYIAFNTAIVNDSKQKFPSNVRCNVSGTV